MNSPGDDLGDGVHLSADEVDEIILSVQGEDVIIVGGQALGIWVKLLLDERTIRKIGGPATSKDMDYFGGRQIASVLSEKLGGRVVYADLSDVGTPQSAIVIYERSGREIQIDIMARLAGLSNKEVSQQYMEVGYGDEEEGESIKVLSPLQVLKTRISGIMTLRRRDPSAIRQMRISALVLAAFIERRLDRILTAEADIEAGIDPEESADALPALRREAQTFIVEMIKIGRGSEMDGIFLKYDVDLLEMAGDLADHPAWHPQFAEHQIRNAVAFGIKQRESRISERERRAPGYLDAPLGAPPKGLS